MLTFLPILRCVFNVGSFENITFTVISQACEGKMNPWLFWHEHNGIQPYSDEIHTCVI